MIAVTGANGYIGRAVLGELIRRGLPFAAISRSNPIDRLGAVQWRIAGPSSPTEANFSDCHTVIHLAGRAHTTLISVNGIDLFDTENRQLALITAQLAYTAGVRRFVFVSTLGVHGRGSDVLLRANSPVHAELPYAQSKWAAEQELSTWCAKHGMELCVVRPPMVYGPSCPGSFLRLVRLVRSGLPLPFSRLHAKRSFIFVENLASFLVECAIQKVTGTYLVSDGSDWSVAHMARAIGEELQQPVHCFPVPPALLRLVGKLIGKQRELDSLTLPMCVDPEPAMRDFCWHPPVTPQKAFSISVRGHAR